jgi:predicted nucleic acid-binding protein
VFKKYADHRLSFTDATIAVYVQDLKLDTIVTLDRDFALAGFPTTPKLKT